MLNKEVYKKGMMLFDDRYHGYDLSEKEYEDLVKDLAWNAFYNGSHRIQTPEEGYYLVTEAYGIEEGLHL